MSSDGSGDFIANIVFVSVLIIVLGIVVVVIGAVHWRGENRKDEVCEQQDGVRVKASRHGDFCIRKSALTQQQEARHVN